MGNDYLPWQTPMEVMVMMVSSETQKTYEILRPCDLWSRKRL